MIKFPVKDFHFNVYVYFQGGQSTARAAIKLEQIIKGANLRCWSERGAFKLGSVFQDTSTLSHASAFLSSSIGSCPNTRLRQVTIERQFSAEVPQDGATRVDQIRQEGLVRSNVRVMSRSLEG